LKETGILEVEQSQAKQKTPAIEAPPTRMELAEPEPSLPSAAPVLSDESMTLCTCCDLLVDKKYDFCWQCGNRLTSEDELLRSHARTSAGNDATLSKATMRKKIVQHEPCSLSGDAFLRSRTGRNGAVQAEGRY
jgi:hypothetical protein